MISKIIIPELGATGGDVTIEEWLVKPGEVVKTGQALYVVATDKATVEIEAYRGGVIQTILVPEGETVPLGTVIALLADSLDEKIELAEDEPEQRSAAPVSEIPKLPTHPSGERVLVSPLARRIAAEENVNLELINGSGSRGQILKRDVVAAISVRKTPPSPTGILRVPLSSMRRTIAQRTSLSKSQIPHFYATATIDMQAAIELRRQALAMAENNGLSKPTITDLCIRATALTLRDFPAINARFDGESITTYRDINIGVVIGLTEGMLIPVIQRADQLNLFSLASATREVRQNAEAGQLRGSEMGEGTFTISNLGMFEIDSFTAVINPPEVAILALGKIKELPVIVDGMFVARPLMIATLSVDHRVVDGIIAARFLTTFKELLENPFRLTIDPPQDTNQ
ncbi:MAG: dihydrolipoamide acetyltransferase family protein [Anaerolineales bacterium]|nr:2-oxo acid dehydrogenase subunit E2 [Anaerolineales bacterium]